MIFLIFFAFLIKSKYKRIKVCICSIGKLENLYVREYIAHYLNYGVDKIFIYDNNDIYGEKFESVINDYILKGFVEIINIRGKLKYQIKAYQDCLDKNYNKYDYLIFYDMDELLYIKNFSNIKIYLSQKKFMKCQTIQLNMVFYTDNNLFYYDNRTVSERFKKFVKRRAEPVKSIVKGNIKTTVQCPHNINRRLKSCDGFGNFNNEQKKGFMNLTPDYYYYYIRHYCFKSTEEFVYKLNRGDALVGKGDFKKMIKIRWYFNFNKINSKKIDYIEKNTKINLNKYRKMIS